MSILGQLKSEKKVANVNSDIPTTDWTVSV